MNKFGRVIRLGGGTLIAISSPNNGAMEAVVSGRLSIFNHVLTLDGNGGDSDNSPAVLLPHDTEVLTETPLTLRVLGHTLRVGDVVDGGGGWVRRGSSLAPLEMPLEFQGRTVVALQTLQ